MSYRIRHQQQVFGGTDPATVTLNASDVHPGAKRIFISWVTAVPATNTNTADLLIDQPAGIYATRTTYSEVLSGPFKIEFDPPMEFLISNGDITITADSSAVEVCRCVVSYYAV